MQQVVKLSKLGSSNAICIPENIWKKLNIDPEAKFYLDVNEKKQIVLTRVENDNYLQTLFKDYDAKESDKVTFDWGEPRGREML
ncbi:hypothetical protein JZO70_12965 [Enterococcus sp. 669A]|uniref:SpoVT-AbrB domain-containing protein n=1 Tax=Candidatus Enterococcus moelleringii TaxID=2815325 RepID=A0ABS3LEA3_9ENTE|nr:hypothetical protein [Enterococcus sp. 669A]MBO1307081.1 hypothetical protein [Enterococcus sp. 669A]